MTLSLRVFAVAAEDQGDVLGQLVQVQVGANRGSQEGDLHAYIVLSLLTRARTEELRVLTWAHVDLDGEPPAVMVWRSVRAGGDTKTRRSRRTLAHSGTTTTETICRKQIRPVLVQGAAVMDAIFPAASHEGSLSRRLPNLLPESAVVTAT